MHINKKFIKIRVLLVTSNFPDRNAWLFLIENDPLKEVRETRNENYGGQQFQGLPFSYTTMEKGTNGISFYFL